MNVLDHPTGSPSNMIDLKCNTFKLFVLNVELCI